LTIGDCRAIVDWVMGDWDRAIVDWRIAAIAESSTIRPIVNRQIVNKSPDRQSPDRQ
jgi:hypothetical protein